MSGRASGSIAVVMGGRSVESDISRATGRAVAAALGDEGFRVTPIEAGADLPARLAEACPDAVFNALHGRWGEDGCAQGIFEWLRLPYTHSGVLASALAMDKARARGVFRAAGLPVAEGLLAPREAVAARHQLDPPYVVKPNNEGSSVGVIIVPEGANAPPRPAVDAPATLLVEAFVPGRELTVTVMGERPLAVTDIIAEGWYDYTAKYRPGASRHLLPAELPATVNDRCLEIALEAHRALGCRGVSRADLRWDEARGAEGLVLLEVNTQPGMTETSLVPEQAAHRGISMPALCRWIVEDASCDR